MSTTRSSLTFVSVTYHSPISHEVSALDVEIQMYLPSHFLVYTRCRQSLCSNGVVGLCSIRGTSPGID